ncbi:MAG: 1-(5-phosphoribosyl)-5-[(5-phosphoribosylamino)methylideneamino]imidazole-4-carboxamide isomerase [Nitrospinota bacterium]
MKIIPAVDIKNGKCVRLFQGRADNETVYSDDPVEEAVRWANEGASLLHLVDLDGAFEGGLKNFSLISEIVKKISVPVEVGGGIRTMESIESYIEAGVSFVILGTVAHTNPEFVSEACKKCPGKIIVGIDAMGGRVAVRGWEDVTGELAVDLARRFEGEGVASIIYTDIERDGTLKGPNLDAVKELAEGLEIPVIASGGVSGLKDIVDLSGLSEYGVSGVIVGKALYDGALSLPEALEAVRKV